MKVTVTIQIESGEYTRQSQAEFSTPLDLFPTERLGRALALALGGVNPPRRSEVVSHMLWGLVDDNVLLDGLDEDFTREMLRGAGSCIGYWFNIDEAEALADGE